MFDLAKKYERYRHNSLYGNPGQPEKRSLSDVADDYIKLVFDMIQEANQIPSREDIRGEDTIDYSLVIPEGERGRDADFPSVKIQTETKEATKNNFYLLIPPLKEGVLKVNRERYLWFKVEEIDEEKKSVKVSIYDFSYERRIQAWIVENYIDDATAYLKADENGENKVLVECTGIQMADYLWASIHGQRVWSDADRKIVEEVVVPFAKGYEEDGEQGRVATKFFQAISETNFQLMQGKPKPQRRRKGAKVKVVFDEAEKNPKPQIVRTLSGGITIKSEKIPRVPSAEVIRHYKVAVWNTRGHIRTYKSGKTVYVKPSVHHRKCMEKGGEKAPQTIIQVRAMA